MYHPNLKAHYRFESTQADLGIDASGNGNDGTVLGATPGIGQFGGGADFDGVNDRIDLPDSVRPVKDFTISGWVYPITHQKAHCAVGLSAKGVLFFYPTATTIRFYVYNGAYKYIDIPQSEFPVNNWYHIVQTYDGINIKLYVNGKFIDSEPCTGNIVYDTRANSIGSYYDYTYSFDGSFDEVKIFNKAYDNLIDVNLLRIGQNPR